MGFCKACGKLLVAGRFPSGRKESPSQLAKRKYCNQKCMAKGMQKDTCRSLSHSRMKAKRHIKEACETCGATGRLHVHHKDENPRNNRPSNLMTLCASCHRLCHSPNGDPTTGRRRPCRFCEMPSYKSRMCNTHLGRLRRYGHPLAKKRKVGSDWILMLHDGTSWLPFPSPERS